MLGNFKFIHRNKETNYFRTICELYHCPTNKISFEFFTMLKKPHKIMRILWSVQASGESRWQQHKVLTSLTIPLYPSDAYLPRVNTEKRQKEQEEERTLRPKQTPNWLNPVDRLELKVTPRPLPSPRIWETGHPHGPLTTTAPHWRHMWNSLALTYILETDTHH